MDKKTTCAPIAPPDEPEGATLRAYAARASLEPWQLAALCAASKHDPDDAIAPEAIADAVMFLNTMSLGG